MSFQLALQSIRITKCIRGGRHVTCRLLTAGPSNVSPLPVLPWFVDPEPISQTFSRRVNPPHLPPKSDLLPSLPVDTPEPLRILHSELCQSPHLEQSTLSISQPAALPLGPPLPDRPAQGRRRRGRTYAGEGVGDVPGSIWSWVVMAQVKEGTENRGAIESVVRVVRKTLLSIQPPLPLPPNSKRRMHNVDHPGLANPTSRTAHGDPLVSNFVTDPTTEDRGAGAGPNFQGDVQAARGFKETAGVIEGRPGIIESTNIDPMNESSNKDDRWANVTSTHYSGTRTGGLVSGASNMAAGVANLAYGTATGNQATQNAGKEAVLGK